MNALNPLNIDVDNSHANLDAAKNVQGQQSMILCAGINGPFYAIRRYFKLFIAVLLLLYSSVKFNLV